MIKDKIFLIIKKIKNMFDRNNYKNETNGILSNYEINILNKWFKNNFNNIKIKLTPNASYAYNAYILCNTNFLDENINEYNTVRVSVTRTKSYNNNLKIMIWDHRYPKMMPYQWPDIRRQIKNDEYVNDTIEKIIEKLDNLKNRIDDDIKMRELKK